MPNPQDFSRLNRRALLEQVSTLVVLCTGLLILATYFSSLGFGGSSERRENSARLEYLLGGSVFALGGFASFYSANRWPRLLKETVQNTHPTPMLVKLKVEQDDDSTSYYALLFEQGEQVGLPSWRVPIWVYPPGMRKDLGQRFQGNVYFHPKTGSPIAIEYSRGILWAMAGPGSRRARLP